MAATTHRPVKVGSKGEDVKRLVHFANSRLGKVNEDRYQAPEAATLGKQQAAAIDRALWVLGFQGLTIWRGKPEHGGHFSVAAQRAIINPSLRTADQIRRARARRAQLAHQHDSQRNAAKKAAVSKGGVRLAIQAAELALAHAPAVHYTQGLRRWEGIRLELVAQHGHYPNWADCSAFYTWCWWQALRGGPDLLNGAAWTGGYTGTLALHGRRVSTPMAGAAVLYGSGWPYEHVALAIGGGMVISHGSEAGPFKLPYNYRRDVAQFRVYH